MSKSTKHQQKCTLNSEILQAQHIITSNSREHLNFMFHMWKYRLTKLFLHQDWKHMKYSIFSYVCVLPFSLCISFNVCVFTSLYVLVFLAFHFFYFNFSVVLLLLYVLHLSNVKSPKQKRATLHEQKASLRMYNPFSVPAWAMCTLHTSSALFSIL